jgi:hypothetical protein
MAYRVAGVELVLRVPARKEEALAGIARAGEDDATALGGILGDGLRGHRVELAPRQDHRSGGSAGAVRHAGRAPPASAGMIETSSPSLSAVARPPSDSMASLFT